MYPLSQRYDRSHLKSSGFHLTRMALRLNALSCFMFGVIFVFTAPATSVFLGAFPELWLVMAGAGLLIHSLHLVLASTRRTLRRGEIYYFIAGDILWFFGSLMILITSDLISTFHGVLATLKVAVLVLLIGLVQSYAYREEFRSDNSVPYTGVDSVGH